MFKTIFCAFVLFAVAAFPAWADQVERKKLLTWARRPISASRPATPTLHCGRPTSKTISARVYTSGWRIGQGDVYISDDSQTGDHVEIKVKVPRIHFNLGNRWVKIEVEMPATTKSDVHTGDGNMPRGWAAGGGQTGDARRQHQARGEGFDGALDASSGDGNIRVRGKFTALNLRSGDGNIEADVAPGSHMATGWNIRREKPAAQWPCTAKAFYLPPNRPLPNGQPWDSIGIAGRQARRATYAIICRVKARAGADFASQEAGGQVLGKSQVKSV